MIKRLQNKILADLTYKFDWARCACTFCYSMFVMLFVSAVVLVVATYFTASVICGFVSTIFLSLGTAFSLSMDTEDDE